MCHSRGKIPGRFSKPGGQGSASPTQQNSPRFFFQFPRKNPGEVANVIHLGSGIIDKNLCMKLPMPQSVFMSLIWKGNTWRDTPWKDGPWKVVPEAVPENMDGPAQVEAAFPATCPNRHGTLHVGHTPVENPVVAGSFEGKTFLLVVAHGIVPLVSLFVFFYLCGSRGAPSPPAARPAPQGACAGSLHPAATGHRT